jgi:RNA polymerase sigma-70 factor (ECF subfamily)
VEWTTSGLESFLMSMIEKKDMTRVTEKDLIGRYLAMKEFFNKYSGYLTQFVLVISQTADDKGCLTGYFIKIFNVIAI